MFFMIQSGGISVDYYVVISFTVEFEVEC